MICVLKKIKKDTKNNNISIDRFLTRMESLDNLRQLTAFIEKKLKNHHKNLLKAGINFHEFKKFGYDNYERTYMLMTELNIPVNKIFYTFCLDYKEKRKHIKKTYPKLANLMTSEDLAPFNFKKIAKKKEKREDDSKKKPYLIFTPMGNKIR